MASNRHTEISCHKSSEIVLEDKQPLKTMCVRACPTLIFLKQTDMFKWKFIGRPKAFENCIDSSSHNYNLHDTDCSFQNNTRQIAGSRKTNAYVIQRHHWQIQRASKYCRCKMIFDSAGKYVFPYLVPLSCPLIPLPSSSDWRGTHRFVPTTGNAVFQNLAPYDTRRSFECFKTILLPRLEDVIRWNLITVRLTNKLSWWWRQYSPLKRPPTHKVASKSKFHCTDRC